MNTILKYNLSHFCNKIWSHKVNGKLLVLNHLVLIISTRFLVIYGVS